jgi:uncharacterized protein
MKRILLLLLPLSVFGQIPDHKPNTYVNDFTNTLTSSEIKELNDSIRALELRTSVEVAIVLVNSTDIDIADYALQLGRKWGVGNAGNGIVYVAALEQHKQRLETGSRIEGSLTDANALEITDNIKPYFRSRDYFGGLMELLNGIKYRIDPAEQLQNLKDQKRRDTKDPTGQIFLSLDIAGSLFFILWWFILRRKKKPEEEEDIPSLTTYRERLYADAPPMPPPPPMPTKRKTEEEYIPPPIISSVPDTSYESPKSSDDNNDFSFGGNDSFSGGGATNDW